MKTFEIKVHFLGASGTVTGSKFVIETPTANILVDCGLFQGLKELRENNWMPFVFPPNKIDILLLTHGHLDHAGYIPRLVAQGYNGPIIGTAPTLSIASVIILDSAKIQEEEAEMANKEHFTIHKPALPFYSTKEAEKSIELFSHAELEKWYTLTQDIRYRFQKNGHILGATFIELEILGKLFVFSGDIGRKNDLLLENPKRPQWADFLFLESTYGNRLHPKEETADQILIDSIEETLHNKGNLIIPSFALERLQTLMYKLWKLYTKNKIPNLPIFIDSPMGNEIFRIFEKFLNWHKISPDELNAMRNHFNIITSYKDTWKTIDNQSPKIVIAGSGMVTGGRVLTYLKYNIDKPNTTVLLVGYQAEGTRGRMLQEGGHEIKLFGKYFTVNAQIKNIQSLSAHADQKELLEWISEIKNIPEQVFLIHGEKIASDALRLKIKDCYHWQTHIPSFNEVIKLQWSKTT
ncbi:MAG: MBL fold metallo-hydrolase [Bacteroidetes bacterium HGW-Bacteroidetes-23]|jgi:metallo-beta-lactamase family protein|nr:MAG: MBL fold metallo-hydrolase [Bacteroidetes bacterium HGW-Bacteroidetes-23]PKP25358.1 MAG: MBL fold metallo-hydrolase [Bacteroidetes bacterium HGW-Bacteroidetes-2]